MRDMRDVLNEIAPEPIQSGKLIKILRKRWNITQEELCKVTGLKRENLSALENGRIDMTVHYAELLGAGLGLHPSTILFPNGIDQVNQKSKEILAIEKRSEALFKKKKAI